MVVEKEWIEQKRILSKSLFGGGEFIKKVIMIFTVLGLTLIIGYNYKVMSCKVIEEELYEMSEGLFGISPHNEGKTTLTVFLAEKPSKDFKSKLKSSVDTCKVDYILYFINPDSGYTDHFGINTLPLIIVGGGGETVLLKTSNFNDLKKFFK